LGAARPHAEKESKNRTHVEESVNSIKLIKAVIDHPVNGRQNLDKYRREFGCWPGCGDRRAWLDGRLGDEIFAAVCRDADEREAELKAMRESNDHRRRAAEASTARPVGS